MIFKVCGINAAGMPTDVRDLGGGDWGMSMVCKQFINQVIGKSPIEKLLTGPVDLYDFMRDFSIKMLSVKPLTDENANIHMRVPYVLFEDSHKTGSLTKQGLQSDIRVIGDKIRFSHKKMLEFHNESLETIGNHLGKIFSMSAYKEISTVIMVGKYAESLILQDCIARRFSSKKLIVPKNARNALLEGAIHFGS